MLYDIYANKKIGFLVVS